MISAVACSREVLQQDFVGVLRTTEARRNTIPPAHALTAKHLLAYLPRPQPQPLRYAPYSYKAAAKPSFASIMSTKPALLAHSTNYANCSSAQEPRPLRATGPGVVPGPAQPEPRGSPSDPAREPPAPQRAARGRNMKRFSSRWQHRGSTAGGVVPAQPSGTRTQRKRCKLLGDPHSPHWPHWPHVAATNQRQRYVAKDGKCNVTLGPIREKSRFLSDIFTTLVDLRYRWFLLVFSLCYVLTWVAFGGIYFLGAWLRDDLAHAQDRQWRACFVNVDGFLSALLLSLESQRTIGYGARMVSSQCPEGAVLLMVQSILGSIIDALMVGCMFVKISRPQQRAQTLIFSKHCVICQRDGKLCLLFRIGDLRESHMVDAKIRAKLIKSRQTKEGEFIPLEQSEINLGYDTGGDRLLLVEPQTIAHLITRSSPFWELSAQRLRRETFEIIVILEGIVEASGMTCQARTSYTEDEVLWGHRFESCISLEKGAFRVDYGAFDKTFEVQMPQLCEKDRNSAQEEEDEILERAREPNTACQ